MDVEVGVEAHGASVATRLGRFEMLRPSRAAMQALPSVSDFEIVDQETSRESPMVTIYGIPNCDTTKKARAWLSAKDVAHDFHDYKVAGIDRARLQRWAKEVGWEILFNRAGTTFRGLPDADKEGIDEAKAIALMLAHTSLIKRPVLEFDGPLLVGFKPERYAEALGSMRRSTSSRSRK
jgi:arsenate reductase